MAWSYRRDTRPNTNQSLLEKRINYVEENTITKVYISTGIPTRIVETCFCWENLGSAGNLSICLNFKVFSFVMSCNNKKVGAIFGCHITFCGITEYL